MKLSTKGRYAMVALTEKIALREGIAAAEERDAVLREALYSLEVYPIERVVRPVDHRDLAEGRFNRGVDDGDEARIDDAAGGGARDVLDAVVEPDIRQGENAGNDGQKDHDVDDRFARHVGAQQDHANQRQQRRDQREHGQHQQHQAQQTLGHEEEDLEGAVDVPIAYMPVSDKLGLLQLDGEIKKEDGHNRRECFL